MIKRFLATSLSLGLTVFGFAPSALAIVKEPAFDAIKVQSLWSQGFTGQGLSIAFIDQGVNLNHEYFQGEVIDGFCLYSQETNNRCPNGTKSQTGPQAASQRLIGSFLALQENHGNMVAGLAAGKPNDMAPGGVAPDAKIVMANIDLTLEGITAAAQYILDNADKNKTAALSLSFGGLFQQMPRSWLKCDDNPGLEELAAVFEKLRLKGILTFASAGNSPTLDVATSVFPSCLKEVVAVGSVNQNNEISWYVTMSQKIELLAPDYALSADTFGYMTASGTSAAAPMAAASFALLKQAFPSLSSETVLQSMKATGLKVDDVIRKDVPLIQLDAAFESLTRRAAGEPVVELGQKISIGSFNGFIAIYTKGYEGRRLSAKVAGRWITVDPITLLPGKDFSRTTVTTGPGRVVKVEVFVDGKREKTAQLLTR